MHSIFLLCMPRQNHQSNIQKHSNMTDFFFQPDLKKTRSLLIVDDDAVFLKRLERTFEKRGFILDSAQNLIEAHARIKKSKPKFAILDLKIDQSCGLDLIAPLLSHNPDCQIVVLTGYDSITSAVLATRLGAIDYLAKSSTIDQIEEALLAKPKSIPEPKSLISADRVRWEYIQRIFELSNRNVSATARLLKIPRRSLQRKLAKRSPI